MSKNKSKKERSNKYRYDVCLDTNIVIAFAGIQNQNEEEIKMLIKDGSLESVVELKEKIEKKKINAYITPTVFAEILKGVKRFGNGTLNYLNTSGIKLIVPNPEALSEFYEDVENIAEIYSKKQRSGFIYKISEKAGCTPDEVTNQVFRLKADKYGNPCPINDARVMAESTLLGTALVTKDYDFLSEHRPLIISKFNEIYGLNTESRPYTPSQMLALEKNKIPVPNLPAKWRNIAVSTDTIQL